MKIGKKKKKSKSGNKGTPGRRRIVVRKARDLDGLPPGVVPASWNEFDVPSWDEPAVEEHPETPINDPLEDYRPPSNNEDPIYKDFKIKKKRGPAKYHEVKFTTKQQKKGPRFSNLTSFEWKLIHARRQELVDKVKNLLKPIRNYSKKGKRDLINSLQIMQEKVKQFY